MGQLNNMICDNSCDRFFHPYDIVGLLHTGCIPEDKSSIEVSSSHTCVYMRNRPLSPQSGGHAVFVRRKIAKHVTVLCDRIEHGVVWLRVESPRQPKKGVYVAFVYLPPQASTYYHQVEGMSYDEHFLKLQQDIMMFQSKGRVVLMGDFNARIGVMNEWDLLDPHILRHYDKQGVCNRKSNDKVHNSSGKRLISLCEDTGMFVMNGRSLSDVNGLITFRSLKGKGQSVIDYAVVSRDLISQDNRYVDMKVIPLHLVPTRFGGGKYDHCPIVVCISWNGFTEMKSETTVNAAKSLRWRHKYRMLYTDILQTDGEVLRHFSQIYDSNTSVSDACESFVQAIMRAAEVLECRVGGVFRVGDKKRKVSWLSAEAKQLRSRLMKAEAEVPRNLNVIGELRCMYRKQVKKDRKAMVKHSLDKVKEDMTRDTKSFWRKFRKGRPVANRFTASEWTNYFDTLFNSEKQDWKSAEEFLQHCDKYNELFGSPSVEHVDVASALNEPFSESEIIAALKAMKLDKAMGADGIPVEFIRQAYFEYTMNGADNRTHTVRDYVVTPVLRALFNKVFSDGVYPPEWAIGIVSPVPKPKGDVNNMDSYRAIAVGSAISKIFAQVILGRLDKWAEDGKWRAKSQFGFRKDLGTTEAVFVLRHLIDKAEDNKKPLYTAFIDFKKAYDSVPRDLLWRCLQKMGIHGHMSDMLQKMYADTRLRVRVDSGFGPDFESSIGVKQGDPLSPLLFGLYIDRFVSFLNQRCPVGDVFCEDEPVQVLLYADDMVLVTHDPKLLQSYLDVLKTFCEATKMTVNAGKSEVMVFFKQHAHGAHTWRFNGRQLKEVKEFTYLGVVLSNRGIKSSIPKAVKRRATKAKSALFGMFGICHGLKVFDIEVLNKLFDGMISPSALYGAEVWGPDVVQLLKDDLIYMPMEETLFLYLRMALMVGKPTPHIAMLRETGRHLFIHECCFKSIGFWNKICERDDDCLVSKATKENMGLISTGWMRSFMQMLDHMAGITPDMHQDGHMARLDRKDIMSKMMIRFEELVKAGYADISHATHNIEGSKVRNCPDDVRNGFKVFKYMHWFQNDFSTPTMCMVQDAFDIRVLARFRCGMHWLATEKDRARGLGRSQRMCSICGNNDREDELHIFFCGAYEGLHNTFTHVFDSDKYRRLKIAYDNDDLNDALVKDFLSQNDRSFVNEFVGFLRRSICIRDRLMNGQSV